MIKVDGTATYKVDFHFELDMTEEDWFALSNRKQNAIIDELIGHGEMRSAEMDDLEVWNMEEVEE